MNSFYFTVYETLRATLKSFNEILNNVNDKLNTFIRRVFLVYHQLIHWFVFVYSFIKTTDIYLAGAYYFNFCSLFESKMQTISYIPMI